MNGTMAGKGTKGVFMTTRWSLVASAADDSGNSLETLCRQYWQPVYAVVRHHGHDVDTAKDLTQGFFANLLAKGWLGSADQAKGRFRTFLITALKRFLVNEWHHQQAIKRGGGAESIPLDTALAERLAPADHELAPDRLFDRRWALALLDAALALLEDEAGPDFAILKDSLTAGRGDTDYPALAHALGTTEGAARVAVHRLRKRYRAIIRAEVSRTVASDQEVEDELHVLMEALG